MLIAEAAAVPETEADHVSRLRRYHDCAARHAFGDGRAEPVQPGLAAGTTRGGEAAQVREFRTRVTFQLPFANVPMVHVGLSGFDIDYRDAARLTVRAANIGPAGFEPVLANWMGTRVYRADIGWIALGHQATIQGRTGQVFLSSRR